MTTISELVIRLRELAMNAEISSNNRFQLNQKVRLNQCKSDTQANVILPLIYQLNPETNPFLYNSRFESPVWLQQVSVQWNRRSGHAPSPNRCESCTAMPINHDGGPRMECFDGPKSIVISPDTETASVTSTEFNLEAHTNLGTRRFRAPNR
jgi:hypothetical protein